MQLTGPLRTAKWNLTHRLTAAGGAIQIEPVTTLDDVAHSSPLIVNCAGLGARALVPDNQVHPVRGHHVIVTNPGLTDFIEADTGDSPALIAIYLQPSHMVLGGTANPTSGTATPIPSPVTPSSSAAPASSPASRARESSTGSERTC